MLAALLLAATVSPFDQVVAAERAFAAASIEKGLHAAFLANLAKDAISFQPLPHPARPNHEGQPPSKGKLNWGPGWVTTSGSGDMAVSIGPWQFLNPEESPFVKPETTGWFISVWRRQADRAWKVAVDSSVELPMTFAIPAAVANGPPPAQGKAKASNTPATARTELTTAERAFAAAAKSGIGGAISAQADPLLRVYRNKAAEEGLAAASGLLEADIRHAACTTDKIVASASGDLGYAYGSCESIGRETPVTVGFLHVWRRQADGSWKLLVDVTP
jgi:ketosteroid isomerase-like protein